MGPPGRRIMMAADVLLPKNLPVLDKELGERVEGAMKGSLEDVVAVLKDVEKLQAEVERGNGNTHSTSYNKMKTKLWNYQALLRFQLLKLVQDLVAEKDCAVDEQVITLGVNNFQILMDLPDQMACIEGKKTAELYSRLSYLACQIGFRFQKRKMYEEALRWCDRASSAYALFKSCGVDSVEIKINTQWLALLKAECLKILGRPEEGLRSLAKELAVEKGYWEHPAICYDLFEQIPWTEISTHWISMYKDIYTANPGFNKTSVDFLEEDDHDDVPLDQETVTKILRLELNTHFATRFGIPDAILAIGEKMLETSASGFDSVLGYLAVAIANSFGSADQVQHGVQLLKECVDLVDKEEFFKKDKNLDGTAFLCGLVSIWRGICVLKSHQYFVETELTALKEQFMELNPEKYKDRDTGEEIRGVSAISTLTFHHERDWVCSLVHGIETLFRFAASEEVLQKTSIEFCPSLVLLSCRLASSLLVAVGDPITGVKGWHVVNKLAKIFDKKGILVLSASEILKIIPDLNCEAVKLAEEANAIAHKNDLIKHNRAMSYRLPLAKSLACYRQKLYEDGVRHLKEVFDHLDAKDNFDSAHHLLGEATYILSLYRTIQYSHSIDLSKFPSALIQMSPVGIATKAFKILGGMTRDSDVLNSGWTDLIHNYFLLSTLFQVGNYTLNLLRESGKTREMKCFANDMVHFAQHCGFISWSVAVIIPLISLDISTRNFLHAQMKIDAINQLFQESICPAEVEDVNELTYQKIIENMKLPLTLQRMECMNDLKWALKTLETPSLYYRNRNEKFITAVRKDVREGFNDITFKFPDWMRHHLSCSCYICCHPRILPLAFEFFHVQARYLNCMSKVKSGMAVLETAKLCHERTVFRVIHNLSLLGMPLTEISSKKFAFKAVEDIYTPFCVGPGIDALMTQILICPVADIKIILNAMKKAKLIVETLDPKDYIGKVFPLDLGYAALCKYLITTKQVKIKGSTIREILEHKLQMQEKENNAENPPVSPTPTEHSATIKSMVPPPKKGALKVTARRLEKQKEEIIDDRPTPRIPILHFEAEEDEDETAEDDSQKSECSTSSSTSLSVSRGVPKAQKSEATLHSLSLPTQPKTANVTVRRPRRGKK